jgi:hypothetical protein
MVMLTSVMTLARSLGVELAVIFHVDDVVMCHGANCGFLGVRRSASRRSATATSNACGFEIDT